MLVNLLVQILTWKGNAIIKWHKKAKILCLLIPTFLVVKAYVIITLHYTGHKRESVLWIHMS